MKKEKDTEAIRIKHTQCETWSLWSVQMFKFRIFPPLLFLCCKVERSYSSPLQFLILSVRSKRAAGPICSLQHCTCSVPQCLVQGRHWVNTCARRKTELQKSQWSGDWDERWEWGKENRTNKSEIMLVKSHNVISEEI